MTETQQGNPEVPEQGPTPYVIDPMLAARLFWAGVVAGEQGLEGDKLLGGFTGCVNENYPSTVRHEDIKRLAAAFEKVMYERRGKPNGK